eukprot:TRINITY_DN91295_c0_g1_i1.p1 TRINITY_DN91295_c0_g1~~TRINITY_DN91295_c0_g1_i1.p1  ORF type:complete len:641 (+),score=98.34 TRINITY_DN91295_c0_g1_i1:46-1923(+)
MPVDGDWHSDLERAEDEDSFEATYCPWALRFHAKASEEAFVESRMQQVLRSWLVVSVLGAALSALNLVAICYYERNSEALPTGVLRSIRLQQLGAGCWLVIGVVSSIIAKTPCLAQHLEGAHIEIILATKGLLVIISACLLKEYSLGKLFNILDYYAQLLGSSCFSDSWLLLILLLVQIAAHLTVHIRWCMLWPLEVVGSVSYIGVISVLGSPEQYSALLWLTYMACLALIIHGKRSGEIMARRMFLLVARERVKRTEAEFQLDQLSDKAPRGRQRLAARSESGADEWSENLSSIIFNSDHRADPGLRLRCMVEFGKKEHWYLPAQSIEFSRSRCLGEGSYGTIYQGKFLHAEVAVKVHQGQDWREGGGSEFNALINEIRLLRQQRHPSIVAFYGVSIEIRTQSILLVEELIKGQSLKTCVESASLPSDAHLLRIFQGICSALSYLHASSLGGRAIVHGDLKPSNIMLDADLNPKLIDFGCSSMQHTRRAGGTAGYMAPEIALGAKPACSSDIYSFGCLVFFTLTSRRPPVFRKATTRRKLAELESQKIEFVHLDWTSQTGLQFQCKQLCASCMLVQPEKRKTSDALLAELLLWGTEDMGSGRRQIDYLSVQDVPTIPITSKISF